MTPTSLTISEPRVKYDLTKYTERHPFAFDVAIDQTEDTRQVYVKTAQPLLDIALQGGCSTVFAYGQTGSGKTFTMLGYETQQGLYSMAAVELFGRLESDSSVSVSFFEIYAGKLFDLLNHRKKIFARADAKDNVVIQGLSEHDVQSPNRLMGIIDAGLKERASGTTAANADSSRSHAILHLTIKKSGAKKFGRLSFIDLAGSERGADTAHCNRQTRMEGADINKSLLALKECIRALAMGSKHIPFRGSKLTSVLKDSFTGKSKAVMIACISPSSGNCEHTLNTLRYANRVKELKTEDQMFNFGADEKEEAPPAGPGRGANPRGSAAGVAEARPGGAARDPHAPRPTRPSVAENVGGGILAQAAQEDPEVAEIIEKHQQVVDKILEEEEDVLLCHRNHVDAKVELLKQELELMEQMDHGLNTNIDDYVSKMDQLLSQQILLINGVRDRLAQFQNRLIEEDILNTTIINTTLKRKKG